ncbi:hypothetical protein HPP92_013918 [Vanilla planifolia]|uniref:Uncharacterized protein n=1 Tax=Vanilla planifolia TaxID=51239 RepID=A0A835UX66_VANPL|nr:hypothetical protein HPP92_013918 [Vanilla planifolia]
MASEAAPMAVDGAPSTDASGDSTSPPSMENPSSPSASVECVPDPSGLQEEGFGMVAAGKSGASSREDRVKGPWSPEEDGMLSRLVAKFGPRNWSLIARGVPGRSGKSCRLRWCNQLDPHVKRKPFTGGFHSNKEDTRRCRDCIVHAKRSRFDVVIQQRRRLIIISLRTMAK